MMKAALLWTFSLSWALSALVLFFMGKPKPELVSSLLYSLATAAVIWIPGFVGMIFAKKEGIQIPVFKNAKWLPVLFGFAALSVIVTYGLSYALPEAFQQKSFLAGSLIGGLFISFFGAFMVLGQEIFWRGYLHEKLKGKGLARASLLIGPFWGLQQGASSVIQDPTLNSFAAVFCLNIALAPLLFWLREKGQPVFITASVAVAMSLILFCLNAAFPVFSSALFGRAGLVWPAGMALLSLLFLAREWKKADAR